MRIALILTSTYAHRPDLGAHSVAAHDAKVVREKLTQKGFEFVVVDLAVSPDVDERVGQVLREHKAGPDDVVVVYVSCQAHLDDAGEISLETDAALAGQEAQGSQRIALSRLRSALNASGVRGAAVVMDLVYAGDADALAAADYVSSVRRVFAPEVSGYSMLCAVRSIGQSLPDRTGPSAFTSLFLKTLDRSESRNAAGAVVVSKVVEQLRDDSDLYTDVPCFSLMAGRRDLPLYSIMEALKHAPDRPSSPLVRDSSPAQSVGVPGLLAAAEQHFARGAWDAAVEEYKKALLLFGEEKSSRRAEVYVRLADMKVAQQRRREAAIGYRKALSVQPTHTGAMRALADVLHSEGDYAEAVRVRRTLLDHTQESEARLGVLMALADDCERARDVKATTEALESAREIAPADTAVLARLAQVYDASHEYLKVVDIKVAIAKLKVQPEELARSLVNAADFARERAEAPERALEIYQLALDADPATARAFDEVLRMLEERSDLDALEKAMLAQTLRLEVAKAEAAQADVWRAIANLRWTRRRDPQGSIEALDRCVTLLPRDVEARAALADLLIETGDVDAALLCLEIAAVHAPGRVETYRRLHEILAKAGRLDRAYLAAAALVELGEAEMQEQVFYDQYHPLTPSRPARPLEEAAWDDLYPADYDLHVRSILSVVSPVAIEFRLGKLQQLKALPPLDPRARQDPATSTVSLTRTFVWASKVLNSPLPEIYVGENVPGGIAAVPAHSPTAMVGKSVLSGKSLLEMAFLVGRDLTYYRPEHYVLVLYATLKDLTALLLAAIKLIRPNLTVPESSKLEVRELTNVFRDKLKAEEQEKLREAVELFDQAGGRVDLVGWARSIEIAATRAGLLLCGDLAVAAKIVENDERGIAELTARDRLNDLIPFSVSGAYAQLRQELGIAVGKPR